MNDDHIDAPDRFATLGATDAAGSPPPLATLRAAAARRHRRKVAGRAGVAAALVVVVVATVGVAVRPGGEGRTVVTGEEGAVTSTSAPRATTTTTHPPTTSTTLLPPEGAPTLPEDPSVVTTVAPTTAAPRPVIPPPASLPALPVAPAGMVALRWDFGDLALGVHPVWPSDTVIRTSFYLQGMCTDMAGEGHFEPFVDPDDITAIVTESAEAVVISLFYVPPQPPDPGVVTCHWPTGRQVALPGPLGDRWLYDGESPAWPRVDPNDHPR